MNEVENKLAASRTRLILDKPFLGALVLRLPLIEAQGNWCNTSATDARSIYYSAAYIEPLSLSQVQFVLAHEALHCGLSHFARREHRDLNRWNLACDYAVNQLLLEDGLELPPGALHDEVYKGLSAEEIYPLIEKNSDEKTMDQHLYDDQDEAGSEVESSDHSEQDQNNKQDTEQNNGQEKNRQPNSDSRQGSNNSSESQPRSDSNKQSGSKAQHQLSGINEKGQAPREADAALEKEASDSTKSQSEQSTSIQSDADQEEGLDQQSTDEQITAQDEGFGDEPVHESAQLANQHHGHRSKSNEDSDGHQTSDGSAEGKAATSRPPPLSAQEREQLNTQWQQRLVSAAQQATAAGKMKGSVARLVDRILRSSVPWRTLLARFLSGASRTDYSFTRPSQRRGGVAILPSLHSQQINVVIALDTSGSIEQDELTEFVTEVNAIKSLVNARITLLACDSLLDDNGPWLFEPWEQMVLPDSFSGNGGTDFNPVFDWVNNSEWPLDLIIYFTDALGRFPQQAPACETLWLVKGPAEVPWGQRIQLN